MERWRKEQAADQRGHRKCYKENIEEAKVKYCTSTSGNRRGEWEKKVMKQKGKQREKKKTENIFINNDLTKQEREMQTKLRTIAKEEKIQGKEAKVGYRKITIEEVQRKWKEERGRVEIFQ
jgi:hypothetical protein